MPLATKRLRRVRQNRLEGLEPRQLMAANQFAVIGDFGSDSSSEAAVANMVKSWNPAYVVTVGDNYYDKGGIDRDVGKYFAPFIGDYHGSYGPGSATNRFFPALGNHDWDDGAKAYLGYFTLPGNERYYDFVQGPVHFFMVDSDSHEPDGNSASSKQGTWLRNALAASTSTFDIVVFHHTAYSSNSSTTGMRWPFKQWGAEVVMAGHVHNYERILVDGLTYFVDGLGGESIAHGSGSLSGSQAFFDDAYGAMRVTVDSAALTFEFFSVQNGGKLIDRFVLSAGDTPPPPPPTDVPKLSIDNISVSEGPSGRTTDAVFTVELDPASADAVTVRYATREDTALENSDFTPLSGSLTFSPGQTTKRITIPVLGDSLSEPDERFGLRLSNPVGAEFGEDEATCTIVNDDEPPDESTQVFLSLAESGSVRSSSGASLAFKDADILKLTIGAAGYAYSLHIDGSDVGLDQSAEDIDAFDILPDGGIVISTIGNYSVSSKYAQPGSGSGSLLSGGGEDLLRFTPSTLGDDTAGSWTRLLDGSTVGLSGSDENIDAVAALPDGRWLISTKANVSVPGVSGRGEDLLAFTPGGSGKWSMYFDGSAVGLSGSDESIDALDVQVGGAALPTLLFSTRDKYSVPGATGADEDVVAFVPTKLGSSTAGAFRSQLALDGSAFGLSSFDVDGVHFVGPGSTATPSSSTTPQPAALSQAAGQTLVALADVRAGLSVSPVQSPSIAVTQSKGSATQPSVLTGSPSVGSPLAANTSRRHRGTSLKLLLQLDHRLVDRALADLQLDADSSSGT